MYIYLCYNLCSTDSDVDFLQFKPVKYPEVYQKDAPLRRRADRVKAAEVAAVSVLSFLSNKGFREYCESRTGGGLDPSIAQTAVNRMAWYLTWSWEQLGRQRCEIEEASEETIKKHLKDVFVESGRLRSVEVFLNYLVTVYQRQPGTLANILDDFDRGVQWFCNEVDRDSSASLARIRTQLASLRRSYRSDQAERSIKVSLLRLHTIYLIRHCSVTLQVKDMDEMIKRKEWPRRGLSELQCYVLKLIRWCKRFVRMVRSKTWPFTVKGYMIYMQVCSTSHINRYT
jgi:hypothetical protein